MTSLSHLNVRSLHSTTQMGRLSAPISSVPSTFRAMLPHRTSLSFTTRKLSCVRAQASGNKKGNKSTDEDPNPFFEPLVRSFILGVGAGALVEAAHVTLQISGMAFNLGYQQLVDALPTVVDELAPMFAVDHVAAVGSWMAFYIIEALAIVSIMDRYPNDKESANKAIRKMVTLPQRMLPLKLQFAKALLTATNRMRGPAVATSSGTLAPARLLPPTPPSTKDMTTSAFVDSSPSSSTTLLEPPSVVRDNPIITSLFPPPTIAPPETSRRPLAPPPTPTPAPATDKPALKGTSSKGKTSARTGLAPGQLDPRTMDFLGTPRLREQEQRERKGYMTNCWYAVALSENVGEKPVGVDILSTRVVLYRDQQGKVKCLQDACPHRGAPLSLGWVAPHNGHDCLVCPYHGWAFDEEGKLQDVPSEEVNTHWPKRSLMTTYPVKEQGGFVWMFYGSKELPEDERPPIPYCPELDDPDWQAVYGEIEFDCGHWGVFENAIDMAHIHYLHGDTFGNQDQPKIHDMKVETDAYSVTASFLIHNKPVNAAWEWTKTPIVPVTARAMLPSSSAITILLGSNVSMITFVNTVPISANRAVNRFCLIRNFAQWPKLDPIAEQAMMRILGEDKVMVEKLRPEMVKQEVSLVADLPQTAFRKLRKEYVARGFWTPAEEELQSAAAQQREPEVDM